MSPEPDCILRVLVFAFQVRLKYECYPLTILELFLTMLYTVVALCGVLRV